MSEVTYYKQFGSKIFFLEFNLPHNLFTNQNPVSCSVKFASVDIADFNKELTPELTAKGPYPIAVRHLDHKYCVVERPPFQISLDYSPTRSGIKRRNVRSVKIWIPWTTVIINHESMSLTDIKMYFSSKPLQSFSDLLIQPYFPNLFGDGKVCMGPGASNKLITTFGENYSIEQLYNFFVNEYFSGGWNADIIPSSYYEVIQKNSHTTYFNKQQQKFKFYTSTHTSFDFANFCYSLSFLSLEETLSLVENATQEKRGYIVMPLSDIIQTNSNNSYFKHPSSFYSSFYSKTQINFTNSLYDPDSLSIYNPDSRNAYFQNCIQVLKQNLIDKIESVIDHFYDEVINKDNNFSSFEFLIEPVSVNAES